MGTCCGQLARGRTHTYTANAGIAYVYEENTLRDAIAGAEPSLLSPVGFLLAQEVEDIISNREMSWLVVLPPLRWGSRRLEEPMFPICSL